MRRWCWSLLLLVGCAPAPRVEPAACNPVPAVVSLLPEGIRVREGLLTRTLSRPDTADYLENRRRMTTLAEEEVRASCSGRPEVLVADERVDTLTVLVAAQALTREPLRPTRVVLRDDLDPKPLAPPLLGACHAAKPPRYCMSSMLDVGSHAARVRWLPTLRPSPSCAPHESPKLRSGDPGPAESPSRTCDAYDDVSRAMAAMTTPPHGIGACGAILVTLHGNPPWGQSRPRLAELAASKRRLEVMQDPDADPEVIPCEEGRPSALETPTR